MNDLIEPKTLEEFVHFTMDFLAQIRANPEEYVYLDNEEITKVDLQRAIQEAIAQADRVLSPLREISENALNEVGLAGAPLRSKLGILRDRIKRFVVNDGQAGDDVLEIATIIWGSLKAVLGNAAEALQEIVQLVKLLRKIRNRT